MSELCSRCKILDVVIAYIDDAKASASEMSVKITTTFVQMRAMNMLSVEVEWAGLVKLFYRSIS